MAFYLRCALIYLGAGALCEAFDIFNFKLAMHPEDLVQVNETLHECVEEWEQYGVTMRRVRGYSRDPARYHYADTSDYDCAWGCFFTRMGWLDDIEGSFQVDRMLEDMAVYMARGPESARAAAAHCVYVNYPHRPYAGPETDCEQAKLLKHCLVKETTLNITGEDKLQMREMLQDWLWICAEQSGVLMEVVVYQVRHPQAVTPTTDPPQLGCAWRCLFIDMFWMDSKFGMLRLRFVRETIRLYYGEEGGYAPEQRVWRLIEAATTCVHAANSVPEDDNMMANGCGRANYFVQCLIRGFFYHQYYYRDFFYKMKNNK